MQRLDKIKAIKDLRAAHGWELRHAKEVCELIEPHIYSVAPEVETEMRKLRDEAECARADLVALVRLVDFFAKRPNEYAAWKRERGLTE